MTHHRPADSAPSRIDLATQGYRRLRELIVRGRLAPGTRIVESDIATRLGLSRTPVRSALHRLQQEGYIVEVDGGLRARLTVAPLTKEDAADLLNIVAEVEGLAARYAAELDARSRAALTTELRALNSDLRNAAKAVHPDGNRFYDLDRAFHYRYVEAAGRPRLLALHDAINPQAERYIRVYTSALADDILTSVREHEAIVDAIETGEADKAQHAVQTNFRNAALRLSLVIESVGERGSW